MKTILLSFVIAVVCFTAKAERNRFHYVLTDSDTLICKNIRIGIVKTKCILLSGKKKIVPTEDINVISTITSRSGMVCWMERKSVYVDNKYTGNTALMELVDVQNGVKIYKYEYFNGNTETVDLILNYYKREALLDTQKNPSLTEVDNYIRQYTDNCDNKELLTSK